jgi:hypothetical protein
MAAADGNSQDITILCIMLQVIQTLDLSKHYYCPDGYRWACTDELNASISQLKQQAAIQAKCNRQYVDNNSCLHHKKLWIRKEILLMSMDMMFTYGDQLTSGLIVNVISMTQLILIS